MTRPKARVGIDLFAGAGGLSRGATLAGIDVTHAIEKDWAAAETYRRNHAGTQLIESDVRAVDPSHLRSRRPFVLFGGPPCQGFSISNQRTRGTANSHNWLFKEFFRFADHLRPEWIVLENVSGLRHTAGGTFERRILNACQRLGYAAAVWTLSAADFGVPQRRKRLFVVARRGRTTPQGPPIGTDPLVTVQAAIGDLPILAVGAYIDSLPYRCAPHSSYARSMRGLLFTSSGHLVTANNALVQLRYAHIPPGGNWQDIPRRLMRNYTNLHDARSRHTGIYRRLRWDEPSVVIANYRKNMLIHPEQHRGLSVREVCRLQSFADGYVFAGSIGLQQQQLSNAVPPLLAKAVFAHIVAQS